MLVNCTLLAKVKAQNSSDSELSRMKKNSSKDAVVVADVEAVAEIDLKLKVVNAAVVRLVVARPNLSSTTTTSPLYELTEVFTEEGHSQVPASLHVLWTQMTKDA
jgi:hypothetical protein